MKSGGEAIPGGAVQSHLSSTCAWSTETPKGRRWKAEGRGVGGARMSPCHHSSTVDGIHVCFPLGAEKLGERVCISRVSPLSSVHRDVSVM
jgi:hypothetical protein